MTKLIWCTLIDKLNDEVFHFGANKHVVVAGFDLSAADEIAQSERIKLRVETEIKRRFHSLEAESV